MATELDLVACLCGAIWPWDRFHRSLKDCPRCSPDKWPGVTSAPVGTLHSDRCKFDISWIGRCKDLADESGYCADHRDKRCSCGTQAVKDCDASIFGLSCGAPLCGKCPCRMH